MGIERVWERWQGRGATTDEKGVQTLKRQWAVTTDDTDTGEPDVVDAVIAFDPTAALFARHPKFLFATCRNLTAAPFEGPKSWLVDGSYSSAPFQGAGGGGAAAGETTGVTAQDPDPKQNTQKTPAQDRPPVITITRKEVTKPLEFDLADPTADPPVRVLNTVGDPFDPGYEVFRSHHIITIKFFRLPAQLDWATRSLFMDSINQAAFKVFGRTYAAHELRCTEYSPETVWESGASGSQLFFQLTVQLEYDPDGWDAAILNTGRRKIVGSEGDPDNPLRKQAIVDAAGQPVADPVPLSEDGRSVIPPGGPYHYVVATGYLEKDWSGLLA